jgi:hypothetical protein
MEGNNNMGFDTGNDIGYDMGYNMGNDMILEPIAQPGTCTPKTIYMVIACIMGLFFCYTMVKSQFSNPVSIALTVLTPGPTLSYMCSKICCFLIGICIVSMIIKSVCKSNTTMAWGILVICVCLQSLCIAYYSKGMFSS